MSSGKLKRHGRRVRHARRNYAYGRRRGGVICRSIRVAEPGITRGLARDLCIVAPARGSRVRGGITPGELLRRCRACHEASPQRTQPEWNTNLHARAPPKQSHPTSVCKSKHSYSCHLVRSHRSMAARMPAANAIRETTSASSLIRCLSRLRQTRTALAASRSESASS